MKRKSSLMPVVLAATALAAASLTACGSGGSASSAHASASSVHASAGVMFFDTNLTYFAPIIQAIRDEGKTMGISVDIVDGQNDVGTQAQLVQQFVSEKKTVIGISGSSADGLVPSVKLANNANIPVIGLSNGIGAGAKLTTYMGSNMIQFGEGLCQAAIEAGGVHARVGIIEGVLGAASTIGKTQGLLDCLKKYPGIKVVAMQSGNYNNANALQVGQDFLQKYGKGQLNVIIGEGPEISAPAEWAYANGRSDVKFISGEISKVVQTDMEKGTIAGAVFTNPYQLGVQFMQNVQLVAEGKTSQIPAPNDYGVLRVVMAADAETVPLQALF